MGKRLALPAISLFVSRQFFAPAKMVITFRKHPLPDPRTMKF